MADRKYRRAVDARSWLPFRHSVFVPLGLPHKMDIEGRWMKRMVSAYASNLPVRQVDEGILHKSYFIIVPVLLQCIENPILTGVPTRYWEEGKIGVKTQYL